MISFITVIVTQITRMATGDLPGVAADNVLQRLKALFTRYALAQQIDRALHTALTEFKRQHQHHPLLHELERNGAFHARSPLVPLLVLLVNDPAHRDQNLTSIALTMRQLAPNATAQQCRDAAAALERDLRHELDAIPEMQEAQRLVRERLHDQNVQEIYHTLIAAPLDPDLHKKLDQYASGLAARLPNSHYSTAHLLYALASRAGTSAQLALEQVGLTAKHLYGAVGQVVEHARFLGHSSPNFDQTLKAAQMLAGQRGAFTTRDDHILEALLDRVDGGKGVSATAVLNHLNIKTGDIRTALAAIEDGASQNETTPRPIWELPTMVDTTPPATKPPTL